MNARRRLVDMVCTAKFVMILRPTNVPFVVSNNKGYDFHNAFFTKEIEDVHEEHYYFVCLFDVVSSRNSK